MLKRHDARLAREIDRVEGVEDFEYDDSLFEQIDRLRAKSYHTELFGDFDEAYD